MEEVDRNRFIAYLSTTLAIFILLSAMNPGAVVGSQRTDNSSAPGGSTHGFSFDIGYLDDTRIGENYTWKALISSTYDIGVMWINNTGTEKDTYAISVTSAPDGWTVSQNKRTVTLDVFNEMGVVLLTYMAPAGASGTQQVNVTVNSMAHPSLSLSMSIFCEVEGTDAQTTVVGDRIMVEYSLVDSEGNALDSGTLPVTAGDKYVGPLNQVGYIEGFYLAALGLRMPLIGSGGETRTFRLPPALAYGEVPPDEEPSNDVQGKILIFTITVLYRLS
ncbi:MAG: FKBP-type peptidyl-prolyl cis-trans isomerase [Candidatus Thermoplasmatota archaeon]|nr:FKBP-type peptidyl-prolyl cis-trans isomerase [Candidatus Thermoplasmatota archaeon]